jgi:hypothetical protein
VALLSAIVPATDRPPTLPLCLAALEVAGADELIVVDEPSRIGPAGARNAGARRATGDLLVFVDSDVLVHPDALARLRAAFARDDGLVAVFGSYDDRVATRGVVSGFRNLLHHVVHQRSAGEANSFWAGLGAVRRDAFDAVGGFDEARYPRPSIEDIELGARLATQGRILLDPRVQGTHLKEWTLSSMVTTDLARRGIPWVELMLERRELQAGLNLGWRERASAVAALTVAWGLLTRRWFPVAVGVAARAGLNRDLDRLLGRQGPARAVAGVALHHVHQLVAVAAVPAGLGTALLRRATRS